MAKRLPTTPDIHKDRHTMTVEALAKILGDLPSPDSAEETAARFIMKNLGGYSFRAADEWQKDSVFIARALEAFALLTQREGLDLTVTYPEREGIGHAEAV